MTRGSVVEYAAAVRDRYRKAGKSLKGKILDEFVRVTGYHRKAAIRMLSGCPARSPGRRGRPASYAAVVQPLKLVWEASDRLCSKRLQPFMAEMIRVLRQHGEQHFGQEVEAVLCRMSAATMDRLLRPYRHSGGRKGMSATRPGSLLKNSIPIRTFADWKEDRPGFLEIDLVAHCGDTTEGFYLNTLSAVDVSTGWVEYIPVWGKWQVRVCTALHNIRHRLPVPLLGVDSDNGSEFINQCFFSYCKREKITFTRSRSYKKNDSCHVEQKNGNVVRRLVGYDRYSTKKAYDCLGRIYADVRLYLNFFQPTMKLWSKTRNGARMHKTYQKAETPYQRLVRSGALSPAKVAELSTIYPGLNPVATLQRINDNLEQLWRLAERTHPTSRYKTKGNLGNRISESIPPASVTV